MQHGQSVVIRDMISGEEKKLLREARLAFVHSPMEQIAIANPKSALVVEVDGEIAGAMFLRVFGVGEKKTGYLELGFVVKKFRGRGIGRLLYPAAIGRLTEMGCDVVSAMVIDDNIASWKSLENQGFGAPSLTEIVRTLGFTRAITIWLKTLLCAACGARFWMNIPVKERSSGQELLSFLWVNLVLFLPGLIRLVTRPGQLIPTLLAYPSVLLAGALLGGIGCLVTRNAWRFSFPRGGALISLFLNTLGVVFPMVGRWYLKESQATAQCRRALGLQAAIEWIGLLLIFSLGAFLLKENAYFYHCAAISANLLVYRLIPFMPFGSFGGARVWAWSKIVFAAFAIVTIALIFLVL